MLPIYKYLRNITQYLSSLGLKKGYKYIWKEKEHRKSKIVSKGAEVDKSYTCKLFYENEKLDPLWISRFAVNNLNCLYIAYTSGFQPFLYYGTPKLFVAPRGTLLK